MKILMRLALGFAMAIACARAAEPAVPVVPPPPKPEPIEVIRLPLPPVASSSEVGSCTSDVNPRGTGCLAKTSDLQSGNFLPDGIHVLAIANFTGAPVYPHPSSVYTGQQMIILKSDGSTFPNGDPWKCITCGASAENTVGRGVALDYPQSFLDGKRVLAGTNIVECPGNLDNESCNADTVRIVPLRWNATADGNGPGGNMRELRLHPDNTHVGFSALSIREVLSQYSFIGRLEYDPAPARGEPLVPRYDVVDVTLLGNDTNFAHVVVDPRDPTQLKIRTGTSYSVGELRGFSGSGREVAYLGSPVESSNIDVFAADLTTGKIRRLTAHPEYVDPMDISPDDQWTAVMDTRGTDRQMFLAGLRGIPPLTDLVSSSTVSSTRNNGKRRFFRTYIIDYYGDRGSYFGQKINGEAVGVPGSGSVNDPEWNSRADPKWSFDGTKIVYTEAQTISPACGGANPLPCYNSTEDGGRTERVMVAYLTSREPLALPPTFVQPAPQTVPWGEPFPPGAEFPERPVPPAGHYTLRGQSSGWAEVALGVECASGELSRVAVEYHEFSDDGLNVLTGTESVVGRRLSPSHTVLEWHSNLTQTGPNNGTKMTSPGGFFISVDVLINDTTYNGTLVASVNGQDYLQPADGT